MRPLHAKCRATPALSGTMQLGMTSAKARITTNVVATDLARTNRRGDVLLMRSNVAAQWRAAPDATNANRLASARPLKQAGWALNYGPLT